MKQPKKILIIRNDKLGDFMLAYPTFNVVKKLFPGSKIYALVPEYTKPMAELCEWIDEIVVDNERDGFSGLLKTISKLRSYDFDAALCLHSTPRIALSLFLAGIEHRFSPASRLDQFFYNHRLTQRRSRSEKPEYEYNIDLANFMGRYFSKTPNIPGGPPYLTLEINSLEEYKQAVLEKYQIGHDKKIIIIHASTGGSAINLNVEQYAELITHLSDDESLFFTLTAGPNEKEIADKLSSQITGINHAVVYSNKGLEEFTKLIASVNLFISGSTGVLHIAGALNVPTVAFYPSRQSATLLRWKTLNSDQKRLAFTIRDENDDDIPSIDLSLISQSISRFF